MAVSIYEQISSNKTKTYLIMGLFMLVISALGYVFGEIYGGSGAGVPTLFLALTFSGVSAFSSYFFADKVALGLAGAKKINRSNNERLYGLVENLCVGSGIKKVPDIYEIDDTAPNAFATGRDPDHASIAVTSGLLQKLEKRELEAVLAHELSHIRNYDIRLMTIVVVLVGTVTIIANIMLRGSFGGENRKNLGFLVLIGFIFALLSPLVAELIKLAVSRSREYLADASASLLTRDPEGLAMALEKISHDKEPLEVASEATAHLYFANPLKKGQNADFWANLFNTHPPVAERIKRLREM